MRRGFMLGKFLPPHAGHVLACEIGARMVDEMTVLVCSIASEPIDGALRAAWMTRCLPACRIVHMHREIPQEPAEHPEFWPIWRAAIREHHPEPIDLVFGSEHYVHRLAAELDARAVVIDPERSLAPVSGSAVRADPARHWQHVPGPVRPHFQRRVTLLGPESAGKTTLAAALAAALAAGATLVPEYGRTYDAEYRRGAAWQAADFLQLAATHRAIREALAERAAPVLVEDTDVIQTAIWSEFLLRDDGACAAELLAGAPLADLYLLLTEDVPWVDDGTRYSGDATDRRWFRERAEAHLRASGRPFVTLTATDPPARLREALAALDDLAG